MFNIDLQYSNYLMVNAMFTGPNMDTSLLVPEIELRITAFKSISFWYIITNNVVKGYPIILYLQTYVFQASKQKDGEDHNG